MVLANLQYKTEQIGQCIKMAKTDIYLTNPTINSGNPVYLKGASLTYAFKPLTRVDPLANAFDIGEVQIAGWENPKVIIRGYINVNQLDSSTIQQSSLLAFAKNQYDGTAGTATSLLVKSGTESSTWNGYLYANDATTSTIRVSVESFDISVDAGDSDEGHLWDYTLNLVETK